ncbi:hypothetical protein GTQ99_23965, partial [Kineococcus sp. T13]|nr:hypothetical protein [Kineococcus vitellinus]
MGGRLGRRRRGRGAAAASGDGRVLAHDAWFPPGPAGAATGRRTLLAHRAGATTLAVTQLVALVDIADGRCRVTATATVPMLQRRALQPLVDAVLAGVRVLPGQHGV